MLPFLFSKEFFSLKNENAETGISGNTLAMPGGQSPDQGCKSFLQPVWPGYFEALNLGQGIKTAEVGAAGYLFKEVETGAGECGVRKGKKGQVRPLQSF